MDRVDRRAGTLRRREQDPSLPARLGEFDYLLGVSDHTRMGALRFRRAGSWLSSEPGVAYLGDVATSPGGARPKANVVNDDGRLAIARDAGLRTPTWSIAAPRSGRAVLVSERFDRDADGRRIGYMSARTALRLGAHDDGSQQTYEDFTDVIAEWSSAPAQDLREMFGRIALTILATVV